MQENIGNDIKRETTLKGPHRDDLNFLKDGLLLKQFGSQGENKTFLIALKFIESAYLKMELNEAPLLLLDDIFGELDEYRINHLMDYVLGIGQSFITTTFEPASVWGGLALKPAIICYISSAPDLPLRTTLVSDTKTGAI